MIENIVEPQEKDVARMGKQDGSSGRLKEPTPRKMGEAWSKIAKDKNKQVKNKKKVLVGNRRMGRVTNVERASTKASDYGVVIWIIVVEVKKKQKPCEKMTTGMIKNEVSQKKAK